MSKRYRRSKLDAYAHLVGRIPDRDVARMAGITPDGVRMYRQRHQIACHGDFKRRVAQLREDAPKRASTATERAYLADVGGRSVVAAARKVPQAARLELLGDVLEVRQ